MTAQPVGFVDGGITGRVDDGIDRDLDRARTAASFGGGGAHPYAAALRAGGGELRVVRHATSTSRAVLHDVARYLAPADAADREVLRRTRGAVLDVGCGPARAVRAAADLGRPALGVDVSPDAVALARSQGLPVLCRSVFDPIPRTGAWGAVLLLDGNVGIGGDVTALLARCAELVGPGGRVVVEADPDPGHDDAFDAVAVDAAGRTSAPFAWAEAGLRTIGRRASGVGLRPALEWHRDGRSFVALERGR
ncbi:class I SAM-dependent methyltransferase [Luteimicrobium subarcticum]|uniref:Methyltransferase family protein n=1 Tax=Luteimicrobium subarcticum TaxID=620910 RepID=A0A2M8W1T8_9MICO|nr:class I SAM-dependent methyltransferase [Luteimicrobium subarcticum]PJI84884.1 methyltransferase family protein [Luteimicrobium subarcticum]